MKKSLFLLVAMATFMPAATSVAQALFVDGATRVERELGTIETGKLADFVPLDADPTEDIGNATKIHTVVKGGVVIDRSRLSIPANGGPS